MICFFAVIFAQALICSYFFRSITNIYHKDETSEYSVFLFQGMLKSSFCGWLFGRSPSGRAFRCKSSLCCGLSPAIPNVGERVFTFLRLHLGARAVPSRRPFPTIPAGCMAEAGHRGGRTNGTRPSVPSHGMKFIIGISLVRPSLSRMNGNAISLLR